MCLLAAGGQENADGCPDDRCGDDGDAPVSQARMAELDAGDTCSHANGEPEAQRGRDLHHGVAPGDEAADGDSGLEAEDGAA